jgi:diguanylate cyclase
MQEIEGAESNVGWRIRLSRFFLRDAPVEIREELTLAQYDQLRSLIPVLYLNTALVTVAGALAAQGDFPVIYQLFLPGLLILASAYRFVVWRKRRGQDIGLAKVRSHLRRTFIMTILLSLLGALWSVGSFYETHETRRVLAAVFIIITSFASAGCLASLPRAAIAAVVVGLAPVSIAMLCSGDLGIQGMALSVIMGATLQIRLVLSKFREMVRALVLQREMRRLADTDALTGLDNRRAFTAALDAAVADADGKAPFSLAMLDLDGFKPANDRFGHAAGDAILVEVARRLRTICSDCRSIARIGGDEFAIILAAGRTGDAAHALVDAARAILALPYVYGGEMIGVSASVGLAHFPSDADNASALLHAADEALYAEKAVRRAARITMLAA